jgi:putative transcriptional regulator
MSAHVDDQLTELVLGTLGGAARADAERHLAACPRCAAELRAVTEALAAVGWAQQSIAPSPSLRERLLAGTQGRFDAFVDRLVQLCDLTREGARAVLDAVGDAQAWMPGPLPGVELMHFEAGPRLAGADTGLVRFAPHTKFPRHTHIGNEVTLVLDGGLALDDGFDLVVGDVLTKLPGTWHAHTAHAGGCLVLTILYGGIQVEGGAPMTIEKPRR